VIVFADFEDPAGFLECFEHGVRGCIARSTGPEIFLAAVRLVLAGGTYVPPEVLAALRRSAAANPRHTRPSLTRRQMAVLSLLTRGMSNRQISVELGVTEGTVKLHVHSILKALNVSNRTEAALVAIETALVPRDSRGL
jgi:DNA-binding NarL/FixJ family response regulator